MADNIAEIRKLFSEAGVELLRDEVWNVQGANVVKHKALERLAAALKIKWTEPKILRAEQDEAVVLVLGSIGDHVEWSIGEARIVPMIDGGRRNDKGKVIWDPKPDAIGNYQVTPKQSAYVWAMAEKRGKDRVIIKLAGIDAYSEEESDDFKDRNQNEPLALSKPTITSGQDELDATVRLREAEKALSEAALYGTTVLVAEWTKLPAQVREGFGDSGRCPQRFKDEAAKHDKR